MNHIPVKSGVQTYGVSFGGSQTNFASNFSGGQTAAAGNLLLVIGGISNYQYSGHTFSLSFNGTGTSNRTSANLVRLTALSNFSHAVWWRVADGTETGVTVTPDIGGATGEFRIYEFDASGLDLSALDSYAIDVSHESAAAAAIGTGTATGTAMSGLAFAVVAADTGPAEFFAGVSWTDNFIPFHSSYEGPYQQGSSAAAMQFSGTNAHSTTRTSNWADIAHGFVFSFAALPTDVTNPNNTGVSVNAAGTKFTISGDEAIRVGAGGLSGLAVTASGGSTTLSYESGAGSTNLVLASTRRIQQGEVVSVAYTQPGNGLEDMAGNDMANFTVSATNSSTYVPGPELSIDGITGAIRHSAEFIVNVLYAGSAGSATIIQGSVTENLTVDYWGSQIGLIVNDLQTSALKPGSATLRITNAADQVSELPVTILSPEGYHFVEITSVALTGYLRSVVDIAVGDGVIIADSVTLNADATWSLAGSVAEGVSEASYCVWRVATQAYTEMESIIVAGGITITDVDTDNQINDEQVNVSYSGTGLSDITGMVISATNTTTTAVLSVSGQLPGAGVIDLIDGGDLPYTDTNHVHTITGKYLESNVVTVGVVYDPPTGFVALPVSVADADTTTATSAFFGATLTANTQVRVPTHVGAVAIAYIMANGNWTGNCTIAAQQQSVPNCQLLLGGDGQTWSALAVTALSSVDATPDAISGVTYNGANPGEAVTSPEIIPQGYDYDVAIPISVAPGLSYQISTNNGAAWSIPTSVTSSFQRASGQPWPRLRFGITASATYGATRTLNATIAGQIVPISVVTMEEVIPVLVAMDLTEPSFRLARSIIATKSSSDPIDLVAAPVAWNPSDDDVFPTTLEKGDTYYNPVYGTLITRVSDSAADQVGGYVGAIYPPSSRAQLYNSDSTMFACMQANGFWIIYNAATHAVVRHMNDNPWPAGNQCELHWHPTDPNKLRYMAQQGLGFIMWERDVITNAVSPLFDLRNVASIANHAGATNIQTAFPTATRFWNGGNGSCSADGNLYGFLVEAGNTPIGMITYNLEQNRIIGCIPASAWGGSRWSHASVTPSGRYYVPGSDTPGVGTRAYRIDLSEFVTLHHKAERSDLGTMPNGNDFYYSYSLQDSDGRFFWTDIDDLFTNAAAINTTVPLGQRWQTGYMYAYAGGANPVNPSGGGFHISARCTNLPGWSIVSAYSSTDLHGWSNGQIFAVEMADDPRIFQIAHPNNDYIGGTHFAEMFATINVDGTKILVASNWGTDAALDPFHLQTYEVSIPAGSIPPHRGA